MAAHDVFLSFPGPKKEAASHLSRLLDEKGYSVFVSTDPTALRGTDRWPEKIRSELEGSRLFVALISPESKTAHYQKDEIVLAIDLARSTPDSLHILPVDLEEPHTARPFGLHGYNGVDARSMDWARLAERIVEEINALDKGASTRQPEKPLPQTAMPRSYGAVLHGAALRVDRYAQWEPIVSFCRGEHSGVFLLHGERKQNLEFFMWRVLHYLADECGPYHSFHIIRLRDENFSVPRSTAAWEHQVRIALGGGEGTATDLLREATRQNPVFMFFRQRPIAHGEFEEPELEAMEKFLRGILAEMVVAAARANPVRMLLAVHYDKSHAGELALEERLDAALRQGCEGKLPYRRLQKLESVGWDHVQDFLDSLHPLPPASVYAKVRRAFDELSQRDPGYEELVQMLDRLLW